MIWMQVTTNLRKQYVALHPLHPVTSFQSSISAANQGATYRDMQWDQEPPPLPNKNSTHPSETAGDGQF